MRGRRASWWLVLSFALLGLFLGNRLGEALQGVVPALAGFGHLGVEPRRLQFLDVTVTLGGNLAVNAGGALGMLLGVVLARRA